MYSPTPKDRYRYNKLASFLYNTLVHTAGTGRTKFLEKVWQAAWTAHCRYFKSPVSTRIHGRKVIVNSGNTYPIYSRRFLELNNPLIELVYQCYSFRKEPVTVIDVGSAIGDTILLLYSNCPNMISDFYCIDGDPEFYEYLKFNLRHLKEGKLIFALLSSAETYEKELVRIHTGTASAQGEKEVVASTLDSIVEKLNPLQIDVLKTDVDGFDGKVLKGAKKIVNRYQPAVIFEWHPILCKQTGNNWLDHFEILDNLGYDNFLWFTKYGSFNHFMRNIDRKGIDLMAELCLKSKTNYDLHYDIIALHRDCKISALALADMVFAKDRKSYY